MYDRWEYTIPANTPETQAIRLECKISPGTLTGLTVYFPAGCQGLARCRVLLGSKPIAPRSLGNYVAAEDMAIIMQNVYETIKGNRPVLDWVLWNVDDTYPHTLWMGAEWISEDEPIALKTYRLTKDMVSILRAMFGR